MSRSLFTGATQRWPTSPLKHVILLNPEVLPETTPADTELSYVDIAALEGGDASAALTPKQLTFEAAPSRARRVLRSGDTVLSTVRTYLKAVANFPDAQPNLIASTGFAVLRPNGKLNSRFAYWAALSEPFIENVVAHSEGVSYPAINPSVLGSLHVPVPSLPEQAHIARFLDDKTAQIDALIAEKDRLVKSLDELRDATCRTALTQGIVKNCSFIESGEQFLGEIPAHWRVVPWKRLGYFTGGAGFPIEFQGVTTEELPFFKVKDLAAKDLLQPLTETDNTVSRDTAANLRATVFPVGTLTFAKVGAALLLLRVRRLGAPGCLDNNMMAFIPDEQVVDPRFAQLALGTLPLAWLVNPGAVPSVSASQVGEVKVALPPLEEQELISRHVVSRFAEFAGVQAHLYEHIARLREYRSSLISAAVTGQIDSAGKETL